MLERFFVVACGHTVFYEVYIGLTIAYKLVLHVISLVLVCLTRNINVKVLNDYYYNTAIIICSTLILIVVCAAVPPLFDFATWSNLIWVIIIFLLITVYLSLTFVPKVS